MEELGGSSRGVLVSNTITERSDLFGAAAIRLGVNNILLSETTANGIANISEFGSYKIEEEFNSLLAMDGYHKVKKRGKKSRCNVDTRGQRFTCSVWMSLKMAARFQAATTGNYPF